MPQTITLLPRHLQFTANTGESVLQAATRQGFQISQACTAGTCQLCEGKLVTGRVSIRQQSESIEATDSSTPQIYCCLAYPLTDIQLEVNNVLAPGELPVHQVAAQVTEVHQANDYVKVITLRLPAGKKITFHPGQYLEVILADGQRAAFSIASAPRQDRSIELHIGKAKDSATYPLLEPLLQVGNILHVSLPHGTTTQLELKDAERLLLIGAATGFSQIKAILEGLIAAGDKRPIEVYWGARRAADLYHHDLMQALADSHANIHYTPVISDDPSWPGRSGLVHKAALEDITNFDGYRIICGGSPPMVYSAFDDFNDAGMQPEQMISDVFDYAPR